MQQLPKSNKANANTAPSANNAAASNAAEAEAAAKAANTGAAGNNPPAASKRKLSYKEQRELDGLPQLIETLELEQSSIRAELADGTLYAQDLQRAIALQQRDGEIEEALLAALERWEALGAYGARHKNRQVKPAFFVCALTGTCASLAL